MFKRDHQSVTETLETIEISMKIYSVILNPFLEVKSLL